MRVGHIHVPFPKRLVPFNTQLDPGLKISIEVNNCCTLDQAAINVWIKAQTLHVPPSVKRLSQPIEGQKTRRQGPKLPQGPVLILFQPVVISGCDICFPPCD